MTEKKAHHRKRKENRVVGTMLETGRMYIGDLKDKKNVKNYLSGEFIHENHRHTRIDYKAELKQLEDDRKKVAENRLERQRLYNIQKLEELFFSKKPLTKLEIIWQSIKTNWNRATALFVSKT